MKNYLRLATGMIAGVMLTLAAGAAMAHTSVAIRIGVPGPAVYAPPAPVYAQPPRVVYVQPRPVYVQPRPVYVERHRHRHGRHDYDRDGVPDRRDRYPANPYRY